MSEFRYPGVGRIAYVLLAISLYVMAVAVTMMCFFGAPYLAHHLTATWQIDAWMWALVIGGNLLILGVLTLAAVLRLRNLGMSGWWSALRYIPFLNVWLLWRMLVCPEGYADHKQLDFPGKIITAFIAVLFGLPLLVVLADAILQAWR